MKPERVKCDECGKIIPWPCELDENEKPERSYNYIYMAKDWWSRKRDGLCLDCYEKQLGMMGRAKCRLKELWDYKKFYIRQILTIAGILALLFLPVVYDIGIDKGRELERATNPVSK